MITIAPLSCLFLSKFYNLSPISIGKPKKGQSKTSTLLREHKTLANPIFFNSISVKALTFNF